MSRRPELALAGVLVALLTPGVAAAATKSGSQTATGGNVSATLSWTGAEYGIKDARLAITRAGAKVFDAEIGKVVLDGSIILGEEDIVVRDLDANGEPEVLVTGYSGGAHCCITLGVFDYRAATNTYGFIVEFFGSYGFNLKDLDGDGKPEIDSLDSRFEDLFTSHAASFPPPRIYSYASNNGAPKLTNRTKAFPAEIRKNAAEAKKLFKHFKPGTPYVSESGGAISAYVADQYLLGRPSVGLKELDHQIKAGRLGTRKQGKAFRARLLRYLHRFGYR